MSSTERCRRKVEPAVVCLLAWALAWATTWAAPPAVRPDSAAGYREHVDAALIHAGRRDVAAEVARGNSQYAAGAAAAFAEAWDWGGRRDPALAAEALRHVAAVVEGWENAQARGDRFRAHNPFFVYAPLLRAVRLLDAGGEIDAGDRERVRRFVVGFYRPLERGDHNRAICAATGLAMAANTFPDAPDAARWRWYAERVWDDWHGHGDTTENAANYNGIVAAYLFPFAEELGRVEALRDARVEAMFARWRDQVSPAGLIAGYGDGDEWANWSGFAAGFERAAAFYGEPTFRWAARRVFEGGSAHRPVRGPDGPAFHLALAARWAEAAIEPTMPATAAAVLTRGEPGEPAALDKLVLGPGRAAGEPFALVDLYSRGGHAHPEWGSVELWEVGGVPLLGGMGYHNRTPAHANLLLMAPPDAEFPHQTRPFEPGVWQTAALPAADLPQLTADPADPADPRRRLDSATFRVETPDAVTLTVDNLRLAGPAGERMLDDFEQQRGWRGGRSIGLVEDATQGRWALRAEIAAAGGTGRGVAFVGRGGIGATFDSTRYDEVRFDWKLSNDRAGWVRPLIFRVMGPDPARPFVDWAVHLPRMRARTVSAEAENRGGDSHGVARFADYFTAGTTLTRRYLLTREGVLLVRDELTPGAGADGWSAGPVWHLHHEPTRGSRWAAAPGAARLDAGGANLLVVHLPEDGHNGEVEVGVRSVKLWGGYEPHTSYARRTLAAGRPAVFTTLLVPHGSDDDPAALARTVRRDGDAVAVTLPDGATLRLQFAGDGGWAVRRN